MEVIFMQITYRQTCYENPPMKDQPMMGDYHCEAVVIFDVFIVPPTRDHLQCFS